LRRGEDRFIRSHWRSILLQGRKRQRQMRGMERRDIKTRQLKAGLDGRDVIFDGGNRKR
jgi:hypothetical protein